MRVVTWNMQAGFGSNSASHDRAWHYLRALDPDIALVQETVPPDWAEREWRVFHSQAYDDQQWGTAVVTRDNVPAWRFELSDECTYLKRYQGSAVVLVEATLDMELVLIVSIYASAHELTPEQVDELRQEGANIDNLTYGGSKRVWPLYPIFDDLMRLLPGRCFVAGGDFNAARSMDQMSWSVSGNVEFFDRIEASGFRPALGRFHNGEVQTYFKAKQHPYQLDHLYCDPNSLGKLASCQVVNHPVTDLELSDHAPIIADFA